MRQSKGSKETKEDIILQLKDQNKNIWTSKPWEKLNAF